MHQTEPIFLARKSELLLRFESVSIIRGKKEVVIMCNRSRNERDGGETRVQRGRGVIGDVVVLIVSQTEPIFLARKSELLLRFESVSIIRGKKEVVITLKSPQHHTQPAALRKLEV